MKTWTTCASDRVGSCSSLVMSASDERADPCPRLFQLLQLLGSRMVLVVDPGTLRAAGHPERRDREGAIADLLPTRLPLLHGRVQLIGWIALGWIEPAVVAVAFQAEELGLRPEHGHHERVTVDRADRDW